MIRNLFVLSIAVGMAAIAAAVQAEAPAGKVKVFILTGQSNMQGKGSMQHLEELVEKEPAIFGHLKKDGKWVERDDCWIFFSSMTARDLPVSGPLKPGYTYPPGRVGPEIGFGKIVADELDEPVVLVKAAWGGQSLAIDFNPPRAGNWDKPVELHDGVKWKPGTMGWAYKQIFGELDLALNDLGKTFPELKGREYEIAGLVWFQGWNDMINGPRRKAYKDNLVHFIHDIRKHLDKPNLPIVIGLVGHGGEKTDNKSQLEMRAAQAAPAEMEEFKGTVIAVPTAPYWDETKHGDGGYHYNGSARFFYLTGEAFGKGMLELLKDQQPR